MYNNKKKKNPKTIPTLFRKYYYYRYIGLGRAAFDTRVPVVDKLQTIVVVVVSLLPSRRCRTAPRNNRFGRVRGDNRRDARRSRPRPVVIYSTPPSKRRSRRPTRSPIGRYRVARYRVAGVAKFASGRVSSARARAHVLSSRPVASRRYTITFVTFCTSARVRFAGVTAVIIVVVGVFSPPPPHLFDISQYYTRTNYRKYTIVYYSLRLRQLTALPTFYRVVRANDRANLSVYE